MRAFRRRNGGAGRTQALSARYLVAACGGLRVRGGRHGLGGSTVPRADLSPAYRERRKPPRPTATGCTGRREGFFEAAIAADGTLALARVHLGRVWWRLGERAAAQAAFEQVVARSTERRLLYLAHLFLGESTRILNGWRRRWRTTGAPSHSTPTRKRPPSRSRHALRLTDQGEESRAVLRHALARAGPRTRDAYWDYLVVNAAGQDELFAALREESLE